MTRARLLCFVAGMGWMPLTVGCADWFSSDLTPVVVVDASHPDGAGGDAQNDAQEASAADTAPPPDASGEHDSGRDAGRDVEDAGKDTGEVDASDASTDAEDAAD